jgi:hypothetical protein
MTQKEAYKIIRCWECEVGEDFFEYFIDNCDLIHIPKLMLWMYQKGYVSLDKLNLYATKYINAKEVYNQPNYDVLIGYNTPYSLFPFGESDELAIFKAEVIFAEFITLHETWCQRLYDFAFKGKWWSSINQEDEDDVNENIKRMENIIETWMDGESDDFDIILALSIDDINNKIRK